MDLPNLLNKLKTKEEVPQRFCAVEITATAVKSAVWQALGARTEVVALGSIQACNPDDQEDLLSAIDTSLSEALASVDKELNQIIFGLPETWVKHEAIAETKKPLLKYACTKLGFKPIGFVVSTEAIVQYLRDVEGGPPSAVLINVSPVEIMVSLTYLGNLQGTQVVGRSNSLAADVEEGLARFPHQDSLPSRMILYDSQDDLEAAKQELISHDWQARLPFLHFPKIESLPKDMTIRAVAVAGGAEVAQSLGLFNPAPAKEALKHSNTPETQPESEPAAAEIDGEIPDLSESFGFTDSPIDEAEVANVRPVDPEEFSSPGVALDAAPAGRKAASPHPPTPAFTPEVSSPGVAPKHSFTLSEVEGPVSGNKNDTAPKPSIGQLKSLFRRLKKPIKPQVAAAPAHSPSPAVKPKRRAFKLTLPVIAGLVLIVIGTLVGGVYAYWHAPKADITLYVALKSLEKEASFTLDPAIQTVDPGSHTIPGERETVSVSGNESMSTTGKKTVGERAKGTVTIYNRTLAAKKLPAGTTLTAGNLKFTLNEEVSIASASTKENADFSLVTEPSKAEGAVTAADIGAQYNLAKDVQFTVANFAQENFIAKANGAFSGGFAEDVKAVSQADLDQLKSQMLAQLEQQVQAKLSQTSGDQNLGVVTTDNYTVKQAEYTQKAGDKADSVALTMAIEQVVYTYRKEDIMNLIQSQASGEIPPGYKLFPNTSDVSIKNNVVNDNQTVTITAKTVLKLSPEQEIDAIKRAIQSKYPNVVESYFKGLPGYVKADVTLTPRLPQFLTTYPRILDHIDLKIKPIDQN